MVEHLHQTGRVGTTYRSHRLKPIAREKRRERRKDEESTDQGAPGVETPRPEDAAGEAPTAGDSAPAPESTGKRIDVVI
jgi:hypothetical protein